MSSTPWAINTEIYPIHVIGTACSLSTTTNWISNSIISSLFLETTKTIKGEVLTYSTLAVISLLAFLFIYHFVPETANKSINLILEEILGEGYTALSQIDPENNSEYEGDMALDKAINCKTPHKSGEKTYSSSLRKSQRQD